MSKEPKEVLPYEIIPKGDIKIALELWKQSGIQFITHPKTPLNILAIDQASKCGWATRNAHGTWDLKTLKDESSGMKMLRFRNKLKEVCQLENINLIAYERVAGQHKNSIIHAAKMVAIIETFCEENNIDYRSYSATEIKKFATGKGNCSKDLMIEFAQKNYGYTGNDDNVADALHIYHLTVKDIDI